MVVLDASALLAYLRHEPGGEVTRRELEAGAVCGAANWSEVMQKASRAGRDVRAVARLLDGFTFAVEPVTKQDAEWAAACWQERPSLSLGDRLCLALAHRLGVPALTADASWGTDEGVRQIR